VQSFPSQLDLSCFVCDNQRRLSLIGTQVELNTDQLGGPGDGEPPVFCFGKAEEKKFAGNVPVFLNRLLGLPVATQALIFNYFQECFEAQVAAGALTRPLLIHVSRFCH